MNKERNSKKIASEPQYLFRCAYSGVRSMLTVHEIELPQILLSLEMNPMSNAAHRAHRNRERRDWLRASVRDRLAALREGDALFC